MQLNPAPVLKLTAGNNLSPDNAVLQDVITEAKINRFRLMLPDGSMR
jgi:hypothetical protein